MTRALAFFLGYLLLALAILAGTSAMQASIDVGVLRAACADGLTAAGTVTAYAPVWLVFALASLIPALLLRKMIPAMRAQAWGPPLLGLAGVMVHAFGILRTFGDGCGGVLDSADIGLSFVLLIASLVAYLLVAIRGAKRLARPA